MKGIMKLISILIWLIGIVIANGFWSTFFAVVIPLYGWYLTIEHFLIKFNIL